MDLGPLWTDADKRCLVCDAPMAVTLSGEACTADADHPTTFAK